MRYLILHLAVVFLVHIGNAQMMQNFIGNDCAGQQHDFYSELDQGKVIVLCWVMPCGACTEGSTSSYEIVKSFQEQYPNKVLYYLADDYGNTNCTSLNKWADLFKMPSSSYSIRFSTPILRMMDFGSNGMPKVVVIGSKDHKVYYNANDVIDSAQLRNAINSAIAQTTSVQEKPNDAELHLSLNPNPITNETLLAFTLQSASVVSVSIVDEAGSLVKSCGEHNLDAGSHKLALVTDELPSGTYFVRVLANAGVDVIKCVVVR